MKKRDQLILGTVIIRKIITFENCFSDSTEVAIENLGNICFGVLEVSCIEPKLTDLHEMAKLREIGKSPMACSTAEIEYFPSTVYTGFVWRVDF